MTQDYGRNVWVSPSPHLNSYIEILTPKVMVFGGAFGRFLNHKGEALMNGISAS